jgi:phage shock protein C
MARTFKKSKNRVLFGVCGGLAEYFGISPTVVRVIFVLIIGIVPYLAGMVTMPTASTNAPSKPNSNPWPDEEGS